MPADNTQITPIEGYDVSRIVFSEPVSGAIPDSKPKIEFKRINISTRNEDGSVGELILPTSRLFSFGVSDRGASIRIPVYTVEHDWNGYLEDRRPASNADPYKILAHIVGTLTK